MESLAEKVARTQRDTRELQARADARIRADYEAHAREIHEFLYGRTK